MSRAWILAAAMTAAMLGRAESREPPAQALVTVFTYDTAARVPLAVMERARRVVNAVFATAGIELRWVERQRLREPCAAAPGEILTVIFDGPAPPQAGPRAMAITDLAEGAPADVRVFYNRVAGFKDRVYMPEFLGNVLAHEITHALQGLPRHSSEGLLKAVWSARDYAEMVRRPLPLSAEDLELLRARFQKQPPAVATLDSGL